MSEVVSSSDKTEEQKRKAVRIRVDFRQNRGKSARSCPEVVPPSDKNEGQKRKAVRIKGDFRQNHGGSARICLK